MIRTPHSLAFLAVTALVTASAQAQTRPQPAGGAVLPLPQGVNRVISIDAQNSILVESGDRGQETYTLFPIRHVYSGGIAQLFGGTSITTEQFVSPGITGGGSGGGFGARNVRGGTGGAGLMQGTTGNQNGVNRTGGTAQRFGLNQLGSLSVGSVALISPAQSQREGN